MFYLLLDHATPTETMIGQLAVPLVVVVSHFTLSEHLLGRHGFGPCVSAGKLAGLTFLRWIVPRTKQFARITTLGLTISLLLLESISDGIVVRLALIFRRFNLLH